MRSCAQLFIGTHDWTAFSHAQAEVESRVRTITRFEVKECWDECGRGQLIELTTSADGFLRYMVRSLAGTLLEVGRGQLDEALIKRALDTGDRRLAGATAPGHGLTLMRVHYE